MLLLYYYKSLLFIIQRIFLKQQIHRQFKPMHLLLRLQRYGKQHVTRKDSEETLHGIYLCTCQVQNEKVPVWGAALVWQKNAMCLYESVI